MRKINIGLIGLGTVGGGAVDIIRKHHDDFARHLGVDLQIVACSARHRASATELGLGDIFVPDANDILSDPNVDIVVELVGGTNAAKGYVIGALKNGKHVVTANKALLASCGKEVFEAAEQGGASIRYGGSVGGGIPIIGPMKHSLQANQITSIMGIVNGTTNFILTRMDSDGLDYQTALQEAQRKGYAEANPSADVDGLDAAAKIAILASIGFNTRVVLDDVHTEGITKITPTDLDFAKEMGYAIKLLAIANFKDEGIDVRVHPAMLSIEHPLATVNGVFNAIYVVGDAVGETMFFGQGAGAGPAASAVMGDVIETACDIAGGVTSFRGCTCTDSHPILPMEDLHAEYYIRIPVLDQPGVFAEIANCFGTQEVSIKSVVQRGGDGRTTDLVVITHMAHEKSIMGAIEGILKTDVIVSEPQVIRLVR